MGPIQLRDQLIFDCPPADVFALLANPETLPRWTESIVRATRTSPTELAPGATYALVGKSPFGEFPGTYRITSYTPAESWSGQFEAAPFSFVESYTLRAIGNATELQMQTTLQPKGVLRPMLSLFRGAFEKQLKEDHRRAKRLLEGQRSSVV